MSNGKLTILLAPTGDDDNDGLSIDTPVSSLTRAHEIVEQECSNEHRDVDIRVGPGEYAGQKTRWSFTMPNHTIHIMPLFNDKVRPRFIGTGGSWFILNHSQGERTNMHFEYIWIQNYQTAISLNGSRATPDSFNSHNRIYGCYFKDIGNVFDPSLRRSTACVRLVNSRHNFIRNNHFVNVINTSSAGLIHAIYAAHYAHHNRIESNRFFRVSGDPIRIRDYSNFNSVIDGNVFQRTGVSAAYSEWYCNSDARCGGIREGCDCTKFRDLAITECPSWGNEFRNNRIGKSFNDGILRHWRLFGPDDHSGCETPSQPNTRRLRTSGNSSLDD